MEKWTVDSAARIYGIDDWGGGYFKIGAGGTVQVDPHRDGRLIDLKELIEDLQEKGLQLPLLLRFSNILEGRIKDLHTAFDRARKRHSYRGSYSCIYPIKVNQRRRVVEEVVRFGLPYNLGLEAGSKPELHAVLAMMDNPRALIVCNGYKDEAYIRMALIGQKLDRKIFIVVERLRELKEILRLAQDLTIRPQIGLRLKLAAAGSGRWESSGGELSKFGLSASAVTKALDMARSMGRLDCISLLHFHLGSQCTDIESIRSSLSEVARYYSELREVGCEIDTIDVGGGLGIDYDGTASDGPSSINYSLQDYADVVIQALDSVCREKGLPHPHIASESGRALTAHHSVLVMDVIDSTTPPLWPGHLGIEESDSPLLLEMQDLLQGMDADNAGPRWKEAHRLKEAVQALFLQGQAGLSERAKSEQVFWTIARRVHQCLGGERALLGDLSQLRERLADHYFCNFSVFQSLPDSWAIGQAFPAMPIHRLDERPDKEAVLQDITCDSDGKVDCYVDSASRSPTLPVHSFRPEDPYLLGFFLVGAYQEILGDLHNLFGDTNTVHVSLDADGRRRFEQIVHGENVRDVLEYVQFDAADLLERVSRMLGIGLGKGLIDTSEAEEMLMLYRQGLEGYTYLLDEGVGVRPRTQ